MTAPVLLSELRRVADDSGATVPGVPVLDSGVSAMRCPRCEVYQLYERSRDGVTIDECGCCGGIWLDRGELEQLLVSARPRRFGKRSAQVIACGRRAKVSL